VKAELISERERREAAEQKLAMYDRQIRADKEELIRDGQKIKSSFRDDTEVRSEPEDVMIICKDFAKKWAKLDRFGAKWSKKEMDAVVRVVSGQDPTSVCCFMAPEYRERFPRDKGAVRMLPEAMLSHFVHHNIFEKPFRLMNGPASVSETETKTLRATILKDLFIEMKKGLQIVHITTSNEADK